MVQSIVTQTSQGTPIPNQQNMNLAGNELALLQHWKAKYSVQLRTQPTGLFNCHGLSFASRRTCISDKSAISQIIKDDGYQQVAPHDVLPGDVILYFVDGGAEHSGIVVQGGMAPGMMLVLSKWGTNGEFIHGAYNSPYGTDVRFFRVDHSSTTAVIASIVLKI